MSLGDWSGGGTPGNIPNPAVKPASADGTWGAAPWESRSLPGDLFPCLETPDVLQYVCSGAWPSGKAADFESVIRRFESYRPSLLFNVPAK